MFSIANDLNLPSKIGKPYEKQNASWHMGQLHKNFSESLADTKKEKNMASVTRTSSKLNQVKRNAPCSP